MILPYGFWTCGSLLRFDLLEEDLPWLWSCLVESIEYVCGFRVSPFGREEEELRKSEEALC